MKKQLLILSIVLLSRYVSAIGDSCSAAIPMPYTANSILTGNNLIGQLRWFSFVPLTSEVSIKLTNTNALGGHIHDIMLMEGLCNPKYYVIGKDSKTDSVLRINLHELVVGVPYFILVMRQRACPKCTTPNALFDLQVQSLPPPVITNSNNVMYLNGIPSHTKNEILIRINKTYLKMNAVDNLAHQDKPMPVFVQPAMIQSMANKIYNGDHIGLGQIHLKRVYPTLTSNDSISISRQGEQIRIPNFWETFILTFPDTMKIFRTSRILSGINGIRYAEPNYIFTPNSVPNDIGYSVFQPNLHSNTAWANANINVEGAWDIETGKTFVKVGVYDTGIDATHSDLSGGKVSGGYNYFSNTTNVTLNDVDGHGTGVAGIIGALRNNNNQLAGIAGGDVALGNTGCSLVDMKIASGAGTFATASIISNAIFAGATSLPSGQGLHIMNNSWVTQTDSRTIYNQIQYAGQNGVVIVAARGNFPAIAPIDKLTFPACYQDEMVINVGASGSDGDWKTTTNGNPSDATDMAFKSMIKSDVDIIAPGTNTVVRTTSAGNNTITTFDGTSAATPHVSGVAALMLSHVDQPIPTLSNFAIEDVENIIQMNAVDKYSAGFDDHTGWGLLNATATMNKIKSPLYKIQHFGVGQNATHSISHVLVAPHVQVVLLYPFGTLAAGIYYADRYEETITLNYNLSSINDQIITSWPRFSSTLGWNASNPQTTDNACQIISVTNTQAVLKTYTYNFLYDQQGNLIVDPWYPTQFSPKAALSIYTYDQSLVGVKELNTDGSQLFNVYPNPAKTNVTVDLKLLETQNISLNIFDIQGKFIKNIINNKVSEGNSKYEISLNEFSEGVYFFKLVTNKTSYSQKLVVIK